MRIAPWFWQETSTSKSTTVFSWLPIPLDQNWAMVNSSVWPPTTGMAKLLETGEENIAALSHLLGLRSGQICISLILGFISWPCWANAERINYSHASCTLPERRQYKIVGSCQTLILSWLPQSNQHQVAPQWISVLCDLFKKHSAAIELDVYKIWILSTYNEWKESDDHLYIHTQLSKTYKLTWQEWHLLKWDKWWPIRYRHRLYYSNRNSKKRTTSWRFTINPIYFKIV